jgi:hypothetical protein
MFPLQVTVMSIGFHSFRDSGQWIPVFMEYRLAVMGN